jgi:predicted dehydrogenase
MAKKNISKLKKTKVGIIGCGMISDTYFNAAKTFNILEVVACADSLPERAEAKSKLYGVPNMTNKEMLAKPEIEIVLNLTPPKQHLEIALATLQAGKHAYSEKPFGIDEEQAAKVMATAKQKGLRVGCAPDTFLGGGQQTARKMIDDGWIGKPIAGTAIVMGRGPEKWAHAPFFYDIGAGPMLDLGPYYITALVNMLGPAKSVTAVTCKGSETRVGGPDTVPHVYPINVTTHLAGMVEFQCGAVITVITSFEVYKHGHSPIEIYGSEGSLQVPDPNTFDGPVRVFRNGYDDWKAVPLSHIYTENSRSIGVADMAYALQTGRKHRVNGELANHVLEIMLSFDKSSKLGKKVELKTTCERPAPLPLGLEHGELDA